MFFRSWTPQLIAWSSSRSSFVEQFLGGKFDIEMKCIEAADEPATKTTENFLQLTCFISPEVKYMHSGLRSVSRQ